MGKVVYISKSRIERKVGPLRIAYLPGEAQPVVFSVHGTLQGGSGDTHGVARGHD
jgi:hypothetical protein